MSNFGVGPNFLHLLLPIYSHGAVTSKTQNVSFMENSTFVKNIGRNSIVTVVTLFTYLLLVFICFLELRPQFADVPNDGFFNQMSACFWS